MLRDRVKSRPAFALAVALTALAWMANGAGFELTGADVGAARDHAVAAAETPVVGVLVSQQNCRQCGGQWSIGPVGATVHSTRNGNLTVWPVPPMGGVVPLHSRCGAPFRVPVATTAGPPRWYIRWASSHEGWRLVSIKPRQCDEAKSFVRAHHARRGQATHPQYEPMDGPVGSVT